MDTALRVFSLVGSEMGGKSSGKEFPVLRQSRDKRTGLWKSPPQKTKHLQRLMPSPELSRLYEEGPLIEDRERKERATPHDG